MKYLYLLVLVTIFSIAVPVEQARAQTDFSKVFSHPYENILSSSVTATYDNCFLISGSRNEKNLLIKIDTAANIVWNNSFGFIDVALSNVVINLYDSTYLMVVNNYVAGSNNSNILCVYFNADGDTIRTSAIDLGGNVNVYSVQQTNELGCVIAADVSNPEKPYTSMAIVKLNSLGDIEWSQRYEGGNLFNSATAIKQTADSGYVVIGNVYNQEPYFHKAFVMKLDELGGVMWAFTYMDDTGTSSVANDIFVDEDGFLISILSMGKLDVLKTDFDGNVIWSKSYYAGYADGYYSIPKNRIYKTKNNTFALLLPDNLIEIDETGNILWRTIFYMYVSDFTMTDDNGFLVIGNGPIIGVKTLITDDPQIGLIKIDSLGYSSGVCTDRTLGSQYDVIILKEDISFVSENMGSSAISSIVFSSDAITSEDGCVAFVGSTPEHQKKEVFHISPNPSNGVFKIDSPYGNGKISIKVYDLFGNELLNKDFVGNNYEINISGNPVGYYFLELVTEGFVEVHKIVLL